ncbi:MAG: collagen-like protein [Ruminococcaceae bacterium]|nr:collagen-like protein [Oscillospiraceae bacterium]
MPSTNKLPNTGLNQWLITDKPVMEDFNRDNEIIDAMAGHLKKTPYIGPDLHWYVWDTDKGEYTKNGMAQGETGPVGPQGVQGPKGDTGEKGETGAGFLLLGVYDSEESLKTAHPSGEDGDAYAVGSEADNTIYIWSTDESTWKNVGKLQGPQGIQGPEGPQGEQGPQGPQGSPSIINGKEPDESGKLTLTAADIGALPGTWRPSATDVTETDSRKFVTAEEKAAIGEMADKVGKSKLVDVTLMAANWVEDAGNGWWTQAVNVAGVTATSPNEILPALGITETQLMEFQSANVQDGGQSAGQITLKAWNFKPSINIPVRVIVRGDL